MSYPFWTMMWFATKDILTGFGTRESRDWLIYCRNKTKQYSYLVKMIIYNMLKISAIFTLLLDFKSLNQLLQQICFFVMYLVLRLLKPEKNWNLFVLPVEFLFSEFLTLFDFATVLSASLFYKRKNNHYKYTKNVYSWKY